MQENNGNSSFYTPPQFTAPQPVQKLGKFQASKMVVMQSMSLLKQDTEIMLFPILSVFFHLISWACISAFFFFAVLHGDMEFFDKAEGSFNAVMIAYIFITYFFATLISVFFQAGIVAIVYGRINGRDFTFSDGMRIAMGKMSRIVVWALIAATVGTILKFVSEKSNSIVTKIVISLLGAVWSVLTFFIVPAIVIEDVSTKESMKKSVDAIKKTWGESAITRIGVDIYLILLTLIGLAVFVGFLFTGKMPLIITALVALIVYIIVLVVIASTLNTIFKVVLYEYARTGRVVGGFSQELVQGAFENK